MNTIAASEDQSFTSFPSLPPSLAASPENSKAQHGSDDRFGTTDASQFTSQTQSPIFDGLFEAVEPAKGQSSLFEDARANTSETPGALSRLSDENIQHLVGRMGAVPLIKQLAEDLAQRDVRITIIQRKADQRERMLKSMLRDCKLSNMEIERQLKALEIATNEKTNATSTNGAAQGAQGQSSQDGEPMHEDSNLQDQVSEALHDLIESTIPASEASEQSERSPLVKPSEISASPRVTVPDIHGSMAITSLKKDPKTKPSGKGWKSYLPSYTATIPANPAKKPLKRALSAQEQLGAIQSASNSANQRSRGRTVDTGGVQHPPRSTTDPDIQAEDPSARRRNESPSSESVKSSNSVASWAYRLVAGRPTDGSDENRRSKSKPKPVRRYDNEPRSNSNLARAETNKSTSSAKSMPAPIEGAVGVRKAPTNFSKSPISGMLPPNSLQKPTETGEARPGPVEMDTILSDQTRPPTLTNYDDLKDSSGVLTDRFGFIYDQRRQRRQDEAAAKLTQKKRSSRVETLENPRRYLNATPPGEEDAVSVNSQTSADGAKSQGANAAVSDEYDDSDSHKKWQDYLKMPSLPTELLLHTPSPAPITSVVTAEAQTDALGLSPMEGSDAEPTSPGLSNRHAKISQEAGLATIKDNKSEAENNENKEPVKHLLEQLNDLHDTFQRERMGRWNDFLRSVQADRRKDGETSAQQCRGSTTVIAVPEMGHMDGEVGFMSLATKGKTGRAKWNEFRSLVLGGIPVALRAKVWAECSGAWSLRIPGYYQDLISTPDDDDPVVVQQVQMDITRTLTDNIFFRHGQGIAKLKEVLLAYARRRPDIGYCQGMNMIAANLLLIMRTAEDAFWVVAALIETILPEKYYDHSLQTSRADQQVLRELVALLLPPLSAHLEELGVELEALSFQWFLSVFTDCLSAEALFRVWDVILCIANSGGAGGSTFLFQVALALLKVNEKQLLACGSAAAVYGYISRHMTDHAISIDGLIRASEGLKRVVKRDDIVTRRERVLEGEAENVRKRDEARKARVKQRNEAPRADKLEPDQEDIVHGVRAPEQADDEDEEDGEEGVRFVREDSLEVRTPMPVDEEVEWRA